MLRGLIEHLDAKAKLYVFGDPAAAAALCHRRSMDFVFTDYKLTHSNGIELITQLKQYPTCSATTFVAVTASDESSVRAEFIRVGALTVLSKPVRKEEIRQILSRFDEPHDPPPLVR